MKKPKSVEEDLTKDTETNYEYYEEIAVTRNDMDMNTSADDRLRYRNRDEESGSAGALVDKEVHGVFQRRRVVFPAARPHGSPVGTPFHTHGTSSSTVLNSDDSARGASPVGEENALGLSTRGVPGHGRGAGMGHAHRGTSKSSFKFLTGPGSSASSHAATGRKRSLSLSGIIRSPTREESGVGLEGALEGIPIPTSPRTHGISERLGSLWRIKRDGREVGGSGYPDGTVNARPGEEAPVDRISTREREREREKHPLDHHYEMETIHSELRHDQEWSLGSVEDIEEDEYRRPRSGRIQGNVTRTGIGGLAQERDLPGVITPQSSRSLERGLFYHE
jgi:hypothetical protein